MLTNQAHKAVNEEAVKDMLCDVFVSLYMRRLELPEDINIMGYFEW